MAGALLSFCLWLFETLAGFFAFFACGSALLSITVWGSEVGISAGGRKPFQNSFRDSGSGGSELPVRKISARGEIRWVNNYRRPVQQPFSCLSAFLYPCRYPSQREEGSESSSCVMQWFFSLINGQCCCHFMLRNCLPFPLSFSMGGGSWCEPVAKNDKETSFFLSLFEPTLFTLRQPIFDRAGQLFRKSEFDRFYGILS